MTFYWKFFPFASDSRVPINKEKNALLSMMCDRIARLKQARKKALSLAESAGFAEK
jgi:hypothetical protein